MAAQTAKWSTAELDARLATAGIPAAQVKQLDQVVEHPQLRARDRWRTIGTEHAPAEALLPPRRSQTPRRPWVTSRRSASTPARCSWSRA